MSPLDRMFWVQDKPKPAPYFGGAELVPVDREVCLLCGGPTHEEIVSQRALFRHGGYGATRETVFMLCDNGECRGVRQRVVTETNPRRVA